MSISASADQKLGQLKAILYLLQTNLEDFKDEVDRSYALLEVGEMTNLSKKIENSLTNPFGSVFQTADKIDNQIKYIVDKIVRTFLRSKAQFVESVFKGKTSNDDLHYSIVLKSDDFETRNTLFDFFDKYDLLDISSRYPVYFQFVPMELIDKVVHLEKLVIEE